MIFMESSIAKILLMLILYNISGVRARHDANHILFIEMDLNCNQGERKKECEAYIKILRFT